MKKKISQIAREDGRYSSAAIQFVCEGLDRAIKTTSDEPRHISGQNLCEELRRSAVNKWGRLAKLVFNVWGIKTTRDFGEIVYLMIEHKWISAQPDDSIEDFNEIYDFDLVFKKEFRF